MDNDNNGDQEVEQTSYCAKLQNSFGGICFGLVLMFGSLGVAGWNEYNNVATMKSINEAQAVIQPIVNCSAPIQSHLEGKLVHVMCPISNLQVLGQTDPVLQGIPPEQRTGLTLDATMQVYQWDESISRHTSTNKNGGGSTTTKTYSYSRKWLPTTPPRVDTSFINSGSKCASKNGGNACWNWDPVVEESSWWSASGYALGTSNIQYSTNVKAGNYIVPDEIIKDFGSPKVLTPSCGGNYSNSITNSSNIPTISNIPDTSPLSCSPGGGGPENGVAKSRFQWTIY